MMRFKETGLAALLVIGGGFAAPAMAAPFAVSSATTVSNATVERVAYGCGPGWSPNRWGECRPMYRRYGYYRPYRGYYATRDYARPVLHVGPFGAGISFR